MANTNYKTRVQLKNDTAANWEKATNFTPLKGEIIIYSDTQQLKIGDGVTKVNDLSFMAGQQLPLIIETTPVEGEEHKYTANTTVDEAIEELGKGRLVYINIADMNLTLALASAVSILGQTVLLYHAIVDDITVVAQMGNQVTVNSILTSKFAKDEDLQALKARVDALGIADEVRY